MLRTTLKYVSTVLFTVLCSSLSAHAFVQYTETQGGFDTEGADRGGYTFEDDDSLLLQYTPEDGPGGYVAQPTDDPGTSDFVFRGDLDKQYEVNDSFFESDTVLIKEMAPSGSHTMLEQGVATYMFDWPMHLILNDIDTFTDMVLPEVADAYDIGSYSDSSEHLEGDRITFKCDAGLLDAIDDSIIGSILDWFGIDLDSPDGYINWDLYMKDFEASYPIDDDTLDSDIRDDERINSDIDFTSADLDAEFRGKFRFACDGLFDTGSFWLTLLEVDVDGAEAEFDLTFEEGSSALKVDEINKMEFEVGSIDLTILSSDTLTSMYETGLSLYEFFGGSCGTTTECVNDAIDKHVEDSRKLEKDLEDLLNNALNYVLSLDGASGGVDASIALADLYSDGSDDKMTTDWDVEVSSSGRSDSCTDGLYRKASYPHDEEDTNSDIDVIVPFHIVGDLAYYTLKNGDITCHEIDEAFAVDGVGTVDLSAELIPDGSMSVTPVLGTTVVMGGGREGTMGFKALGAEDYLYITYPFTIQNIDATLEANPLSGEGDGEFTGSAVLAVEPQLTCDNGLELVLQDAYVNQLEGSIVFDVEAFGHDVAEVELLAADLEDSLNEEIEAMADEIGAIEILDRVTSLHSFGDLALYLNKVKMTEGSFTTGIDIVDEVDCDDGGDGGSGKDDNPWGIDLGTPYNPKDDDDSMLPTEDDILDFGGISDWMNEDGTGPGDNNDDGVGREINF